MDFDGFSCLTIDLNAKKSPFFKEVLTTLTVRSHCQIFFVFFILYLALCLLHPDKTEPIVSFMDRDTKCLGVMEPPWYAGGRGLFQHETFHLFPPPVLPLFYSLLFPPVESL